MNKISKKIVALVTMAAFVLTLVPAAAFADAGDSYFTVEAKDYQTAEITLNLDAADVPGGTSQNSVVWATNASGACVATDVQFEGVSDNITDLKVWPDNGNASYFSTTAAGEYIIKATFNNPGTYTIHVATNPNSASSINDEKLIAVKVKGSTATTASFTRANFADRSKSEYGVIKGGVVQDTASVNINKDLTTTFKINDGRGAATAAPLKNVKVWAIDSRTDDPTSYLVVEGQAVGADYMADLAEVFNGDTLKVQFTTAGTYTLYAGVDENGKLNKLLGATEVTVSDTTEIDTIVLTDENGDELPYDNESKTFTLDLTDDAVRGDFLFNGSTTYVLDGTAYDGNSLALNQTITFDTTRTDVFEFVDADKTVNTSNTGTFAVEFSMQDQKNGIIVLTDEKTGEEYNVRVIAINTSAHDIDRTKTGGYVIASTDDNFADNINSNLADAVQFAITDEKGDAVTGQDAIAGEPAAIEGQQNGYIRIMSQPEDSTLTAEDLILVADGDNYTLAYVGDNSEDDLIAGKYQVRVSLLSNDNATVTFTAAEFGTVKDVELDLRAWNMGALTELLQKPTDPGYSVDDEVTLGQIVVATATYVDENGIKIAATDNDDVEYGFDGKAVRDDDPSDNIFATALDIPANESLLGTVIKVKAYVNKQLVEKELTVVDSYNTYSLEFEPTNGPINEDNDVTVKVVDKDGNVSKVNGNITAAFVDDKSNADAKISVDVANDAVRNGEATISVYSDRETTADIVVVVKAGTAIYAGTLEYTFGTEDPLANRSVVMTIGSTEYVVNNNIVTGDAAPFVDSNWRTMVPIRALAESFDAEVKWNNTDRTVTINYDGGTQIVMTIGDETYTVNGAEQTMDTEPVIQGDRTYVPIRFAAEGMGFSVTPLYNSNGLTGSVVFQR